MKITYPDHCGNSPKKKLLIELYQALGEGDLQFIGENLESEVHLQIIGLQDVTGLENVLKAAEQVLDRGLAELEIHDAITHGNTAAVHGALLFRDGLRLEFCDVYRFKGFKKDAKIQEIKSYLVNPDKHSIL